MKSYIATNRMCLIGTSSEIMSHLQELLRQHVEEQNLKRLPIHEEPISLLIEQSQRRVLSL
jgi:hypothetical protein